MFKSLQSNGWERHINLWSLYDVVSAIIEINTEWWQSKKKKQRTHLGMLSQEEKEKMTTRTGHNELSEKVHLGLRRWDAFTGCFVFSSPTLTDIKIWKNRNYSLSQMEVQYEFSAKFQLHFLTECINKGQLYTIQGACLSSVKTQLTKVRLYICPCVGIIDKNWKNSFLLLYCASICCGKNDRKKLTNQYSICCLHVWHFKKFFSPWLQLCFPHSLTPRMSWFLCSGAFLSLEGFLLGVNSSTASDDTWGKRNESNPQQTWQHRALKKTPRWGYIPKIPHCYVTVLWLFLNGFSCCHVLWSLEAEACSA